MKSSRPAPMLLVVAFALSIISGCAQDIEDVNRVQPNALQKSDFEGVWYIRHTVTDVPPTLSGIFVGVASQMEKIRWEIREDKLVAYRSYEKFPGYDQDAGDIDNGETQYADGVAEGRDPDAYKEEPVAMYPILSHFDIQRQYDPSTGEQTNVVVENRSDRPWNERDYFRVDWSSNLINMSFPSQLDDLADGGFYVGETEQTDETIQFERAQLDDDDASELSYLDFVAKYQIGDNEVKIRSSFSRLPNYQRDYQPVFYNDDMMTKFGYFRTERMVYDRSYGFTDSGRIYLANRHDIWLNDFKHDENGDFVRDAEGRRVPTPMEDRRPKPVTYFLSPNFPDRVRDGAQAVASGWNRALTRAAAAAKGMDPDDFSDRYGDMFVLCDTRLEADSPHRSVCDPRAADARFDDQGHYQPYKAKLGDVRDSFMVWVDQPQNGGLLGYGPSYPDPESGEIISGTAYVYGASVDSYAQRGVDIVKYVNGDTDLDGLRNGDYVRQYVLDQLRNGLDPRARNTAAENQSLADIPVDQVQQRMLPTDVNNILDDVDDRGLEQLKVSPTYTQQRIDRMKEAGLDRTLIDDEFARAVGGEDVSPTNLTEADIQTILDKQNPVELDQYKRTQQDRIGEAARHNMYLNEFADPAVMGTALRFEGRTDYEAIRKEIRNEVYGAVTAHEVGHTLGLRDNFAGSYDSVNFFDKYWELRQENFEMPRTIADLYATSQVTPNQANGNMGTKMYSSIMDYHARFNGDWSGIGKYDEAAILFAYTFGTYDEIGPDHSGAIPVEEGYVEVFDNVPSSVSLPQYQQSINPRSLFHSYDDRYAASQHPLEDFHYTSVVQMLGGPDNLNQRHLMRYDRLMAQQKADDPQRAVEVQYMFCSDEWVGATMSCDRFDLGADPLEIARSAIQSYKAYYPFTHFRRDRYQFNSLSGAASATRVFNKMPSIYHRWFLNQFSGGDPILSNYFLFGAYAGFNLLSDVLTMPGYGGYELNEETGKYDQLDRDPTCQTSGEDVDLCIRPGRGRTLYSRYDYGGGYYYFTRVTETGHYWDAVFAMQAMTQSVATTLGVDQAGQSATYLLPYYLVFEDELTDQFNGIIQDQPTGGPVYSEQDGLRSRPRATLEVDGIGELDPLTGEVLDDPAQSTANAKPVNVDLAWTEQVYSLIYSLAFFNSSYSQHFIDQARVFKLGNGEQLVAPEGSNFEVRTFTDPSTGITYGALAKPGATGEDASLAVQLVERGQQFVADAEAGDTNAEFRVDNLVEDINRVIGAIDGLGGERY